MRSVVFVLGCIGTFGLVFAMVQSMLISRSSRNFISNGVNGIVKAFAQLPLRLIRSYEARDRWLSTAAPGALLLQLTVYAVLFIFTLGLMVWGSSELSFANAIYQAGSTFTTLGIVLPVTPVSTAVTFLAAFLGLVVVAVFIGYLLAMYGMYSDREATMARLSTFAGEPAWGPEFLARANRIGRPLGQEPDSAVVLDWVSQLRLNQVMNPVLSQFRSPSPNRHWIITLLAALDAVALRLALGESVDIPSDIQLITEGSLTLGLCDGVREHNWTIERQVLGAVREPVPASHPHTLTDDEWSAGWSELLAGGLQPQVAEAEVRARFELLRACYYGHAQALSRRLHAVRAPWSGERDFAAPVVWPMLSAKEQS